MFVRLLQVVVGLDEKRRTLCLIVFCVERCIGQGIRLLSWSLFLFGSGYCRLNSLCLASIVFNGGFVTWSLFVLDVDCYYLKTL